MQDTFQESTSVAKAAYEAFAASHGVKLKRYKANNCRFAEQEFQAAFESSNQTLTAFGVGAHHQT